MIGDATDDGGGWRTAAARELAEYEAQPARAHAIVIHVGGPVCRCLPVAVLDDSGAVVGWSHAEPVARVARVEGGHP